jgi:hypothetical protein
VYSSMTVAGRPFLVLSWTKSQAQKWFLLSGLSLTLDLSFSHNDPLPGCQGGTFSPSRRQIRSTLWWLASNPAPLSGAVIRR